MSNYHLFRLFSRDLLRDKFFSVFFILNLTLALSGLIGLENFKAAFTFSINSRAKEIAGSDLSISGRRKISDQKLDQVIESLKPEDYQKKVSFFSMAKSNARSRLVRVAVYDDKFPFYGKRDYQPKVRNLEKKDIIIYPPVRDLFKVDVGDFLTVGKRDFRIVSIVENDSSETFDMGQVVPRFSCQMRRFNGGSF